MSTKRRKDAPAPLSQRELDTLQGAYRRAANHPWRKRFKGM
jgi:hypothetical protein